MDKVNFLATDDYPVSTNTFDLMQRMTFLSAQTALIGGNDYILSGCIEDSNGNVSDGIVVINGELLPFIGGQKKDKIAINEVKRTLEAFDQEYREAEIIHSATFSDNGQYNWSEFKQVLSNKELEKKISEIRGEPLGIKMEWTGKIDRIPENYMLADGRILRTAEYPDLAWFYGFEKEESFALPDLRSKFIVGYDSKNPEYNSVGLTGGSETVTLTTSQIPPHNHVNKPLFNKLSAKAGDIDDQSTPGDIDQINAAREYNVGGMTEDRWLDATIQSVGGGQSHENRPPYYVLAYVIKVKY